MHTGNHASNVYYTAILTGTCIKMVHLYQRVYIIYVLLQFRNCRKLRLRKRERGKGKERERERKCHAARAL